MYKYVDRNLIEEGYVDPTLISPHCVVQVVEVLDKMRKHSLETYYHLIDVANLTKLIFEHADFGLTEKEKAEIYTAGLLHDIGKLKVPVDILHSKCDEKGVKYIQLTHTKEGKKMLDKIIDDDVIKTIAYHHHEKPNGTGYPQSLPGEKQDIKDRIVQVADVTSALMMPRSYRETYLDRVTAGKILKSNAERGLLDGTIVEIMIQQMAIYNPTDEFMK